METVSQQRISDDKPTHIITACDHDDTCPSCGAGYQVGMTIKVRIAWWVRWYISGVALCAFITGAQPDMEKIKDKVMKGVRIACP